MLLSGADGVGKTTLAELTAEALAEQFEVAWVVGSRSLVDAPLGALEPWRVTGQNESPETQAMVELASRLGASDESPSIVVADDLHWVDRASRDVLSRLARDQTIRLLGTTVEGTLDLGRGRDRGLVSLDVPPLDRQETAGLLATVLDGDISPDLLHEVWRRTLGVPLQVRELVALASGSGAIVRQGGRFVFDEEAFSRQATASGALVGRALNAEPELTDLLAMTAIAEPVPVRYVVQATSPEQVARAVAQHLVSMVDLGGEDHLRFAHPLYGDAVRQRLGALERRRAVAALNDALGKPEVLTTQDRVRHARWSLLAGVKLPPDRAVEAARAGIACGDLDLAQRCAHAAWVERPDAETALVAGIVANYLGDVEEAERALVYAQAHATSPMQHADAALHRLPAFAADKVEAAAMVTAALSDVDDPGTRLMLAVRAAWTGVALGYPAVAIAVGAPLLEDPGLDRTSRDELLLVLSAARLLTGELAGVAADLEELRPDRPEGPPRGWFNWAPLPPTLHALLLVEQGEAAAGLAEAEHEYEHGGDEVSLEVKAWSSFVCGQACMSLGRFLDATDWFRMSLTVPASRALRERLAGFGLSEAATLAGDEWSADLATSLLGRMPRSADHVVDGRVARSRAVLAAASGEGIDQAADNLRSAARTLHLYELGALEIEVLHELALLNRAAPADAERGRVLAARIGGRLPALTVDHLDAAIGADVARLASLVDEFDRVGARWSAARAASGAADLAVRKGELGAAERLTGRSRTMAAELGVAREARPPTLGARLLGRRERQIARRAAQRIPARAISIELDISVRTVENALGRVYTKLGLTSRDELAELFDEPS